MKRKAAVAGAFYPGSAGELKRQLGGLIDLEADKISAKAVISPHAGYIYSGPVAGAVFSSVVVPDCAVILAPSHRPIRPVFALMDEGSWETPLGLVPVERDLAAAIQKAGRFAVVDPSAHEKEHSLEVQLPFLQFLNPRISIVPIAVSYLASYEQLEDLGRAVAAGIRDLNLVGAAGRDVLIVASTDMSHYLSRREAETQDFIAIRKILALDPRGLFDVVKAEDISMCGFQPTAAALVAAKELGAAKAELVMYATSGDRTGDDREVVGYAGLRIF
jgi:AmmeMemoRadiSam system protein B